MVDTAPVPARESPTDFLRRCLPTFAALAAGCALGWCFRVELLNLLVDPWLDPNRLLEGHPSSEEVSLWFLLIAATVGIVLALPWLTALAWGLAVPRSRPIKGRSAYVFICSSYAAIGIGLCLAAFLVFPAFLLHQREAWQGVVPVPWAYVELELRGSVGFALAFQLCALLVALTRA